MKAEVGKSIAAPRYLLIGVNCSLNWIRFRCFFISIISYSDASLFTDIPSGLSGTHGNFLSWLLSSHCTHMNNIKPILTGHTRDLGPALSDLMLSPPCAALGEPRIPSNA